MWLATTKMDFRGTASEIRMRKSPLAMVKHNQDGLDDANYNRVLPDLITEIEVRGNLLPTDILYHLYPHDNLLEPSRS